MMDSFMDDLGHRCMEMGGFLRAAVVFSTNSSTSTLSNIFSFGCLESDGICAHPINDRPVRRLRQRAGRGQQRKQDGGHRRQGERNNVISTTEPRVIW